MYTREALKFLKKWHLKENRKPLILRGARQVGKTTLVEQFSKNFKQYIYLNLDQPEDKKVFETARSFDQLIEAIYFIKNASNAEKETLLFIDEIQNSPAAVKFLRYFYENKKELTVIAAGSLLESLTDKNISFPVGRVEYLAIRPFSFREFLLSGENKNLLEALATITFPEYAHDKLTALFRKYIMAGGMPEVVRLLNENNDLVEVKKTVRDLMIAYKEDVEKYARNENQGKIIRFIIDNAFHHASERITFTNFADSGYRSREVSEAFRILEKTMVLSLIYPSTSTRLPLTRNHKMSPKLQMLDTGLVNLLSGIEKEILLNENLTDVYRGRIAEHIIGQELLSEELSPDANLVFWVRAKKQSDAEVDYLLLHNGKIIPVEVKSGPTGKMRSLHIFIDQSKSDIAVRFYTGKFQLTNEITPEGRKYRLLNMPLFLCSEINNYLDYYNN